MKKIVFLIFILVLIGGYAQAKTFKQMMPIADFEDLVVKSEDGSFKLNNFSIAEKKAFLARGLTNLSVSHSARNKSDRSVHFSVSIVGIGGSDLLWAVSLEPMMSTLVANKTDTLKEDIYIEPNKLSKTTHIAIWVTGDFN